MIAYEIEGEIVVDRTKDGFDEALKAVNDSISGVRGFYSNMFRSVSVSEDQIESPPDERRTLLRVCVDGGIEGAFPGKITELIDNAVLSFARKFSVEAAVLDTTYCGDSVIMCVGPDRKSEIAAEIKHYETEKERLDGMIYGLREEYFKLDDGDNRDTPSGRQKKTPNLSM